MIENEVLPAVAAIIANSVADLCQITEAAR
ncbi:UNVERIFIED_ORG: hypothetical protein J2W38_005359 [Variovorax paradoxus]|nr:hypothetical protein [Variovorax paradoxus]